MSQAQFNIPPFHLAFPVTNLNATRDFYMRILKCRIGRESERWIDFDFFGHQITAHLDEASSQDVGRNDVDKKSIPARHFGAILPWDQWDQLVTRIKSHKVAFYVEPYTRFAGEVGEQRTFFIQDPSENYLEFKCFKQQSSIFQNEL